MTDRDLLDALEQIDAMRQQDTEHFVSEPLEPGEIIPRSYGKGYKSARQQVRDGDPIRWDWEIVDCVWEIIAIIEQHPHHDDLNYVDALRHFKMVPNPTLSDEAQTQHFDIGGRRLWDFYIETYRGMGDLGNAVARWQALGGT